MGELFCLISAQHKVEQTTSLEDSRLLSSYEAPVCNNFYLKRSLWDVQSPCGPLDTAEDWEIASGIC